jgi:hypothetical protein
LLSLLSPLLLSILVVRHLGTGALIIPQINIQICALHETPDLGRVLACYLLQFLPTGVPLLRLCDAAVLYLRYPLLVHFPSLYGKEGVRSRSFDISVTHNKRIHTHKVSDAQFAALQVFSYRFESIACKQTIRERLSAASMDRFAIAHLCSVLVCCS